MFKTREDLIEEAMGLKGMIAEIQAKARLWKMKAENERDGVTYDPDFMEHADNAAEQMEEDLATYSQRLQEICEELGDEIP